MYTSSEMNLRKSHDSNINSIDNLQKPMIANAYRHSKKTSIICKPLPNGSYRNSHEAPETFAVRKYTSKRKSSLIKFKGTYTRNIKTDAFLENLKNKKNTENNRFDVNNIRTGMVSARQIKNMYPSTTNAQAQRGLYSTTKGNQQYLYIISIILKFILLFYELIINKRN